MNERQIFLRALVKDEDDLVTRMVYADWLEEHHEYEEADRQRKWPAAKQYLVSLCGDEREEDEDYSAGYKRLIAFGLRVVEEERGTEVHVEDDVNVKDFDEFFRNWSIVTDIPLPEHLKYQSYYWSCCANETYWIGGVRPAEDSVEQIQSQEKPSADEQVPRVTRDELDEVRERLERDQSRSGKWRKS